MTANPGEQNLRMLVDRYDRPGPRYTSYPTVPEWSDSYGPQDFKQAICGAAARTDEPLSLYLHIPFCRKRCWFCGCNTNVTGSPNSADAYLIRIRRETEIISQLLKDRKGVSQLHWGGGTPTILTTDQTREAYRIHTDHFDINNNAEISVELDPRVTTPERIDLFKKLGFNRLSLGVQDLDENVQAAIGRDQNAGKTIELYHHCRRMGFPGINFDLIYGLPKQTPDSFRQTVNHVISLRPDRIALYSFAYLPQLKANQKKIEPADLPEAETKLQLFLIARKLFLDGGYVQIGMDHFVLPDDELALAMKRGKLRRNFMGYTINAAEDWLGIGISSISYIDRQFAQNASGISSYYEAIDNDRPAIYRGLKLSDDDVIRQQVITDLMCNFRVDLNTISRQFGIETEDYFAVELAKLQPFVDDSLVTRDKNIIAVTDMGQLFVRNIAMLFDVYLTKSNTDRPRGQFSRTV
ncbi:MAG: oxygen-independent coproporphyrinogen III oxidase [candidate division Zixibacteria bacterium]|nr:oxygen-independent coproporphyrinogen III oxidase [candidate division Zixibacteria bacterium]